MIELSKIRIDGGTQSRIEPNQDVVAEYAEAYRTGVQMPPVSVFYDGSTFWLADGFHRYFGAKQAGCSTIHEDITPGTRRDAVLYSLGANSKHGLRRSNADKRRAVETMLDDPEWSEWSDVAIAKAAGVSSNFVGDVRRIINPINDSHTKTVTRNGKTYQQNTAKIGTRAQAKPDTSVPVKTASSPKAIAPAPADSARTAQSELEELKDFCAEQGQNLKATLEENESMSRVLEEDDKIAAAMAESKRFSEMNRVLTERNNGLMNELAESVRLLKSWKRRAEKAEAAIALREGA